MNYINILEKCDLFQDIDVNKISDILSCLNYTIKDYNSGDIIFLSSDKINSIGILLEGELQITKEDILGNRNILSKIYKSDIFGEAIVCSDSNESPVNVICTKKSKILFIPYKKIITTCSSSCYFHTQLIANLLKIISTKNIFLNHKIEILTCKTIREKINTFFMNQITLNKSYEFEIPFSRQELADFLNINRSALSRELSNMQNENLIEFNKNKFKIK